MTNPEKLDAPIRVFRKMFGEELMLYVDGKDIKPINDHSFEQVSSSTSLALYFSPETIVYSDKPYEAANEVVSGGEAVSPEERVKIWESGNVLQTNVLAEFSTNIPPTVSTGLYSGKFIKEYTYPSYSSKDFSLEKLYKIEDIDGYVDEVYDRSKFSDDVAANEALRLIAANIAEESRLKTRSTGEGALIAAALKGIKLPKPE